MLTLFWNKTAHFKQLALVIVSNVQSFFFVYRPFQYSLFDRDGGVLNNVDKNRERQHYFVQFYYEQKAKKKNKNKYGATDGWKMQTTQSLFCGGKFSFR